MKFLFDVFDTPVEPVSLPTMFDWLDSTLNA